MTSIPAWINGYLVAVDKLRVHRAGLRHKAVSVFVVSGDEVLLQRRASGKYHSPGLWTNTCCTHPQWGECPRNCARRRLDEELGISGGEPLDRGQVEYRADVGGGMTEHEVVDLFLAHHAPKHALTPDAEEVADVRWTRIGDLTQDVTLRPELYTPWLRIYLANYSGLIFGGPNVA